MPHNLKVNVLPQEYVDKHVFDNIVKRLEHPELDLNIFNCWKHGITRLQRFKSCLISLTEEVIEANKEFNFYKFLEENEVDKVVIKELQDVINQSEEEIQIGDVDAYLEILRVLNNQEDSADITQEMVKNGKVNS